MNFIICAIKARSTLCSLPILKSFDQAWKKAPCKENAYPYSLHCNCSLLDGFSKCLQRPLERPGRFNLCQLQCGPRVLSRRSVPHRDLGTLGKRICYGLFSHSTKLPRWAASFNTLQCSNLLQKCSTMQASSILWYTQHTCIFAQLCLHYTFIIYLCPRIAMILHC